MSLDLGQKGVDKLGASMSLKVRLLTGERFLPKIAMWLLLFLFLNFLADQYYLVIARDVYPGVHLQGFQRHLIDIN